MQSLSRYSWWFFHVLPFIASCLFVNPVFAAESEHGVLDIVLDKVLISPKAGLMFWQTGWKELQPSVAAVDLTQYIGKKTARVFRGEINPGSFDALHLKIKSIDALLKKTRRSAAVKNTIGAVKLSFQV